MNIQKLDELIDDEVGGIQPGELFLLPQILKTTPYIIVRHSMLWRLYREEISILCDKVKLEIDKFMKEKDNLRTDKTRLDRIMYEIIGPTGFKVPITSLANIKHT